MFPQKQPRIPTVYQKEQFPYTNRIPKGKLPVYQAYTNLSSVFHIIFFLSSIPFIINKCDIIIIFFIWHFLQDLLAAQKQRLLIENMVFKAMWFSVPEDMPSSFERLPNWEWYKLPRERGKPGLDSDSMKL